ncbi:response regulator [Anaerostipes sp.]|uniref:response regulator n=1 Tax=Anaerostipes sp. TaxID=1872530 RepID=UPI0025BC9BFF|nr:response regulator [Anaerostipes sp.]MBS7008770.1 response regulator [Anaerostipes sp.]
MKIISVDNEKMAVEYMSGLVQKVIPQAEFAGFTEASDALDYLAENAADVAFLDIEMGEYNGIDLAGRFKKICPKINIIFVTGYSDYTMDALRLHVSGYLMKPVRADDLRTELENLRHPIQIPVHQRVRIQTFGNFEIFVDGRPLKLPLTKCRECLAYLVDRKGALVTVAELAGILFEDKPFSSALRNSVYQITFNLTKALKEAGVEDILIKQSRKLAIDPSKVDCDYYRALSGDVGQLNLFAGEYMSNYSWAEFTVGELLYLKQKL